MINAVMPNCGTGPIEDAINYLKSDFDHEGTLRKISHVTLQVMQSSAFLLEIP